MRVNVAKTYGIALFKKSFDEYVDGKPSKFANAVKARLTIVCERERVANNPVGLLGRVANVFV